MARSFNGSTDKIEADAPPSYTIVAPYTFAVWVQNNSNAAGNRTAFINESGGSNQSYIRVGGNAANTPEFGFWNGSANHLVLGASTLSLNTWYQLTGTYDGTTYKIYTNGVVATSTDSTGPNFVVSFASIGWDFTSGARFWNGRIADMAIWNVVLTAGEASALANGARPPTIRPNALLRYWPLDGLQSPEPDLSGHVNNGTVTGTALAAGPPVMMFTPHWPQFISGAAAASSVVSRRSLSALGTRVGSRQVQL
jgi:hypothetical protein